MISAENATSMWPYLRNKWFDAMTAHNGGISHVWTLGHEMPNLLNFYVQEVVALQSKLNIKSILVLNVTLQCHNNVNDTIDCHLPILIILIADLPWLNIIRCMMCKHMSFEQWSYVEHRIWLDGLENSSWLKTVWPVWYLINRYDIFAAPSSQGPRIFMHCKVYQYLTRNKDLRLISEQRQCTIKSLLRVKYWKLYNCKNNIKNFCS